MTTTDVYQRLIDVMINKTGPDEWRNAEPMVVEIKVPQAVQDELSKISALFAMNQARMESQMFSALVLDGLKYQTQNRSKKGESDDEGGIVVAGSC